MTAEPTTTARQRVADGLSPENLPTHIRIDVSALGGRVETSMVLEVDDRTDPASIWKRAEEWDRTWVDPAFADHPGANRGGYPYLLPYELYDDADDMISTGLADDVYDAIKVVADAAGIPFEWTWLDAGDCYVLAWLNEDGSISLDHAYDEEGRIRLDDMRMGLNWRWERR